MPIEKNEVQSFLDKLASATPTPGGGSSAALCGATAAALVSMVANLTIDKEKHKENWIIMKEVLGRSEFLRLKFLDLANQDIKAYSDFSLAQHGGARREVGAQTHALGFGDAHAGGHDVVDHPRHAVDGIDVDQAAHAQVGAQRLEVVGLAGALVRPGDDVEFVEHVRHLDGVGGDDAVRQQVQAQVGVVGIHRRLGQVGDGGPHRDLFDPAVLVEEDLAQQLRGEVLRAEAPGPRFGDGVVELGDRKSVV